MIVDREGKRNETKLTIVDNVLLIYEYHKCERE